MNLKFSLVLCPKLIGFFECDHLFSSNWHVGVASDSGCWVLRRSRCGYRWDVPDLCSVFADCPIGGKLSRSGYAFDGHAAPLILIPVGLVHFLLRIEVAVEVVTNKIVVPTINKVVDHVNESLGVSAKLAGLNRLINSA